MTLSTVVGAGAAVSKPPHANPAVPVLAPVATRSGMIGHGH